MRFLYGANTDIGNSRRFQEDHIMCKEYDTASGKDLLAIIADGTGTSDDRLQPAILATNAVIESIDGIKNEAEYLFRQDILFFIKKAMLEANNALGVLKMANEEFYSGYACSMTVLYITEKGEIFYGHAGNTRIYLLRQGMLNLLTNDHTKAQQRLDNGENIDYYASSDRLIMTNGIGLVADPEIYTNQGRIKENDILIMTTDGVHYAIQPEYIKSIVLESADPVTAATNLVISSRDVVQYPDNVSAIVIAEQK